MSEGWEARLFRNGRDHAARIPREVGFPGERFIVRKVRHRLILEAIPRQSLLDVLGELSPMHVSEGLPDVDDFLGLHPDSVR